MHNPMCPQFPPRQSETVSSNRRMWGAAPPERGLMTSARVGALNEILRKERGSMDLWCRQGTLIDEPAGSPAAQAPYYFGAPPGLPASVEHLRPAASLPQHPHSPLPQLSRHRQSRRRSAVHTPEPALAPAAADPLRTLLAYAGPRLGVQTPSWGQFLKEQLLEAEDAGEDALSVYIMRKHSRRFMPGSHYDLQLRGTQPCRLFSSVGGEGLLPAHPELKGRH